MRKEFNYKSDSCALGVIRLDYNYDPAPGDIDCPDTFGYKVFYHSVPGYTFENCQDNIVDAKMNKNFDAAIQHLVVNKKVKGITGDCGFMMYIQDKIRNHPDTQVPVFMSALAQLPAIRCAYGPDEIIAILTANSATLKPMQKLINKECAVDVTDDRFIIVGA